jgi:hypothetical protein
MNVDYAKHSFNKKCVHHKIEGLKTINHFQSFIDNLVHQLEAMKRTQNAERQELVLLRDALKSSMTSYKEVSKKKLIKMKRI